MTIAVAVLGTRRRRVSCIAALSAGAIASLLAALASPADAPADDAPKQIASVEDLWRGFDPEAQPLDVETIRTWEEDGAAFQTLRFTGETAGDAKVRVYAIQGAPREGKGLPGSSTSTAAVRRRRSTGSDSGRSAATSASRSTSAAAGRSAPTSPIGAPSSKETWRRRPAASSFGRRRASRRGTTGRWFPARADPAVVPPPGRPHAARRLRRQRRRIADVDDRRVRLAREGGRPDLRLRLQLRPPQRPMEHPRPERRLQPLPARPVSRGPRPVRLMPAAVPERDQRRPRTDGPRI